MRQSDGHRRWVAATAIATLVLLASCTAGPSRRPALATFGGEPAPVSTAVSASTSTMPIGPGGPGRDVAPIQWTDCPADVPVAADGTTFTVRCAALSVPILYQQPLRGHLTLQVAEARGEDTPADAPPLVVALDDPGARSYADIAAIAASLPETVRQRYAIVTADARGTGASTGVDCVSDSTAAAILGMAADPAAADGAAQLSAIERQLTFDCGDMTGAALTTINSTNAADDLDSIRAALGVPTLSLLASAGSATIGAVYADRYPGRVAAMVLASPGDPLTSPQQHATESATASESLFDNFAAACAGFDGDCPLGDDPRSTVQQLVSRLATSGVSSGRWVMTGGSVLTALTELLPDAGSWPALAAAIAALDADDAEPLARMLTTTGDGPKLTARLSARILYTCSDSAARLSPSDITTAARAAAAPAPLFGPFAVATAALCSAWPAPDEALGRLSGAGAAPIVVIGSVLAADHPYREAQAVAGQLSSAVLVSWQSGHATSYPGSACVQAAVDGYLLHGVVPDRGLLCPP
jgi:pimeloyl-ACP methyl ester carboxylesterase